MDREAASRVDIAENRYRPLITADVDVSAEERVVRHRYSHGGVVRQVALDDRDASGYRYVVTLDNLSMKDARELDELVDGTFDPEKGRLRITYVGDRAIARYLANPRLDAVAAMEME